MYRVVLYTMHELLSTIYWETYQIPEYLGEYTLEKVERLAPYFEVRFIVFNFLLKVKVIGRQISVTNTLRG